jgi:hypothetical protein
MRSRLRRWMCRRRDALEKRRKLMEAWAVYCEAPKSSKVVTFQCTFALPLLVDAVTGFGNPVNMVRTVKVCRYQRIGFSRLRLVG